jgi:hypothetical protein
MGRISQIDPDDEGRNSDDVRRPRHAWRAREERSQWSGELPGTGRASIGQILLMAWDKPGMVRGKVSPHWAAAPSILWGARHGCAAILMPVLPNSVWKKLYLFFKFCQ